MKQRVATITLNPAYDLVGFCPSIMQGEVNRVQSAGFYAAGKGINVAKIIHALGEETVVGGLLGQDNQDGFLHLFQQLGLKNHFQLVPGRTRINVKLTENFGEVTDFNFSGFTITDDEWQRFSHDSLHWLKDVDAVAVSGSLPKGVGEANFCDWLKQVKNICPKLVFDSSREALTAGLSMNPWLIKPNKKELEVWAGRALPTLDDVITVGRDLRSQGIEHVVISLGEQGALWLNEQGAWLAKPPACTIVSTVGAGDAMVGGLLHGLLNDFSHEETLRLATAIAALAVSRSDVALASLEDIEAMKAQIQIERLAI